MKSLILLFVLGVTPQNFTSFSYCKENVRGLYQTQCITLKPDGQGEVRFKRRDAEMVNVVIQLSPAAAERFLAVLAGANYLEQVAAYESNRKVADLGKKTLTLEMASGKREGSFNYSSRKEVVDLQSFFEGLINQEEIAFDIDNALQFERLSLSKRLEYVENQLRSNRIADPVRMIPMLEKIKSDRRLMKIAQDHAERIKQQIQARK